MPVINQGSWPRRKHFSIFRGLEYSHNSVSVQVDITALWERRDRLGTSPTIGLVYVLARAARRVPELRAAHLRRAGDRARCDSPSHPGARR